jgi:hypothetical protein
MNLLTLCYLHFHPFGMVQARMCLGARYELDELGGALEVLVRSFGCSYGGLFPGVPFQHLLSRRAGPAHAFLIKSGTSIPVPYLVAETL